MSGPPPIVDYWCNAFTPDRAPRWEAALAQQGVPIKLRTAADDSFCEPDQMIAKMDELGITTLILPVGDPHGAGGDPTDFGWTAAVTMDELATLAPRSPGRLVGMFSYDPTSGRRGLDAARRALEDPSIVALHLHTHSFDKGFDDRDQYPFYALAGEAGVPVVMQAGTSGGLAPSECGRPLGIDRPAIFFDNVDFVLSHTGWPWVEEAIAMALKFPNVYLGTAVYPARHWPESLREFVARAGRGKVLYGSGFPAAGHRHTISQLDSLDARDEVMELYLGGVARRLFTRLPSSIGA